jgi:hypothetical protein
MAAITRETDRVSYNFAFWSGANDLDPEQVYRQLNDERHIAEVDVVDRKLVLEAIAEHLAGWSWDGQILQPPGTDPDEVPAFDVSIDKQLVEFCRLRVGTRTRERDHRRHASPRTAALRPSG